MGEDRPCGISKRFDRPGKGFADASPRDGDRERGVRVAETTAVGESAGQDEWAIKRLVYERIRDLGFTSLTAFEQHKGLPANALHYHLRPRKLGTWPDLDVINRFADALQLTTEEVSAAFAKDFAKVKGLDVVTAARTAAQRRMEELLAGMDERWQWLAVEQVEVLARHCGA